jgi:hypothetical protein
MVKFRQFRDPALLSNERRRGRQRHSTGTEGCDNASDKASPLGHSCHNYVLSVSVGAATNSAKTVERGDPDCRREIAVAAATDGVPLDARRHSLRNRK